jgi:superfamily II DNA or RNA helicase
MQQIDSIAIYLRRFAHQLEDRILKQFPPLHQPEDPLPPELRRLRRTPYPAQALAIAGLAKRLRSERCAGAIAECGTGKTLISLGAIFVHAKGKPFTALAMVPPQLVTKMARECFLTLPRVRVFLIDGVRNGVGSNGFAGVNEVRLRNGRIIREALQTTLSDLRLRKEHGSARARWNAICDCPAVFIVGRDRAKLSYHWRHAFHTPRSGPFNGAVVNPDTGRPVLTTDDQLRRADFRKVKHSELVLPDEQTGIPKSRRAFFSPLWQADGTKIRRCAPMDFVGRYMKGFFDYGIADEVHELKGDTAQGAALGTIASCADRTIILTGTLNGGYADELFNILFRLHPKKMLEEGFAYGDAGVRAFSETYGVLEKVTTITPADNVCSDKPKITTRVRRRPGASPLLFGRFLMELGAFVSLDDISDALPSYEEEVVSIEMDPILAKTYEQIETDIKRALEEHRGNQSVISTGLNALMLYPDRPFDLGTLHGYCVDPETGERERFVITDPPDLDQHFIYAKERRLVDEVKAELAQGRRCQIFAVYTQKRDVTQRLKEILSREGIHVEVLTTAVPPEAREAWYERQLKAGMQVCISHPRLVATGMDLLAQPTILFYESGYSIFTLRQASRRSWRIGQTRPVKVKFMAYAGTMQESCLRLMGKKLLVSLAMEGKFASHGLQSLDEDDDMLTAMARELVTQKGVGERADELWKQIQRQQATVVECSRPMIVEPSTPAVVEDRPSEANRSPLSETAATANALIEMALESPRSGRKSRYDDGAQLSLAF